MRPEKSPSEVADELNVHRTTPIQWCKRHGIGRRVGGRWRIPAHAVELIRRGIPLKEVAAHVYDK